MKQRCSKYEISSDREDDQELCYLPTILDFINQSRTKNCTFKGAMSVVLQITLEHNQEFGILLFLFT